VGASATDDDALDGGLADALPPRGVGLVCASLFNAPASRSA